MALTFQSHMEDPRSAVDVRHALEGALSDPDGLVNARQITVLESSASTQADEGSQAQPGFRFAPRLILEVRSARRVCHCARTAL